VIKADGAFLKGVLIPELERATVTGETVLPWCGSGLGSVVDMKQGSGSTGGLCWGGDVLTYQVSRSLASLGGGALEPRGV